MCVFVEIEKKKKLNVQAYHGGEGGDGSDMDGVNVAICTIEKANSIVNRLAEEKRLQVRVYYLEVFVSVTAGGGGVIISQFFLFSCRLFPADWRNNLNVSFKIRTYVSERTTAVVVMMR